MYRRIVPTAIISFTRQLCSIIASPLANRSSGIFGTLFKFVVSFIVSCRSQKKIFYVTGDAILIIL